MAKINIPNITSVNTIVDAVNQRFDLVEAEFEKVLYRQNPGTEPNEMDNDLDMNNRHILNLPDPVFPTSPVRLQDLQALQQNGDHGLLQGLTDDDHPQYLNETRGDVRYYQKTEVDTLLSNQVTYIDAADAALQSQIDFLTLTKSDVGHIHDDRYYTETEMDALLANKSDIGHTHVQYVTATDLTALLATKSDVGHTHDGADLTSVGAAAGDIIIADGVNGVAWIPSSTWITDAVEAATGIVLDSPVLVGTVTSVESTNLNVTDPLILLADGNATTSLDLGIIMERSGNNVGLIWDESADEFALIETTDDATTVGNVTIANYAGLQVGNLIAASATVNGTTTFVGIPSGPTASVGTNTTQLATTAFVNAEIVNDAVPRVASTDNAIARFNGTTGAIQNSGVLVTDSDVVQAAGISFDSGTNVMAEFEEGEWTPTLEGLTTAGSLNYAAQYGNYTRIGDFLTVTYTIVITTVNTAPVGTLVIKGLPFNVANNDGASTGSNHQNTGTAKVTRQTVSPMWNHFCLVGSDELQYRTVTSTGTDKTLVATDLAGFNSLTATGTAFLRVV